jgi:hypothetical protein
MTAVIIILDTYIIDLRKNMQDTYSGILDLVNAAFLAINEACDCHSTYLSPIVLR